jgi:hypothetical protein
MLHLNTHRGLCQSEEYGCLDKDLSEYRNISIKFVCVFYPEPSSVSLQEYPLFIPISMLSKLGYLPFPMVSKIFNDIELLPKKLK